MKFDDILRKFWAESFIQKDKGTQFERPMRSYYNENYDRGKLIMVCGTCKTYAVLENA